MFYISFVYARMVGLNLKWKSECFSVSSPLVYVVHIDAVVYSNIAFYLVTFTKYISVELMASG